MADVTQLHREATTRGLILMERVLGQKTYDMVASDAVVIRETNGWTKTALVIEPTQARTIGQEPTELQKQKTITQIDLSDLKGMIEGIGEAAEKELKEAGIKDLKMLASTKEETLKAILEKSKTLKMLDPSTWAQQARLASEGKLTELKEWQKQLNKGK